MATKLSELKYKYQPQAGSNALTASRESVLYGNPVLDGNDVTSEVDALLASLASGSPDVMADRQQFGAAIAEPILQIVPYMEQYDRLFMQQTIGELEDNLIGVEDLTNVAYTSSARAEILFNEPGYRFTRPTFTTFQTGFKIAWPTLRKAGWNILARQMNYVAWELARKRDAAAKVVLDAGIPTNHIYSVTGVLTKSTVDSILRSSNAIGFPVKMAVINPGVLMEMQSWTWTMPTISFKLADTLVDNLFYGQYGGINWYSHPYVPIDQVYFAGDPTQVGWHQRKGSPRNDTYVDIIQGEDDYAFRDAEHSWYVGSGVALWRVDIS